MYSAYWHVISLPLNCVALILVLVALRYPVVVRPALYLLAPYGAIVALLAFLELVLRHPAWAPDLYQHGTSAIPVLALALWKWHKEHSTPI